MRLPKTVAVAMLVCLVLLITSGLSLAETSVSERDPQDVEGRLDLVFVQYTGTTEDMRLVLRTAERWRNGYLSDAGDGGHVAYLIWEFDRNGDGSFDCTGRFFVTEANKIKFERSAPGEQRAFAARRPTRRSVAVSIPADFCGFRSGSHLRAQSVVTGAAGDGVQVEQVDIAPTLRP